MKTISKTVNIPLSAPAAFEAFVYQLQAWWPMEYTWSQDKLVEIKIDPVVDGLCTESGPFGFRCDWGRVTAVEPNRLLAFKWQIGPQREPVPDSEKAGEVRIKFEEQDGSTTVQLEHTGFERHGEKGQEYQEAMDSPQGWDHILKAYTTFVGKTS